MAITIASYNINGSRRPLRRFNHLSTMRDGKYAVSFLQETHTTPGDEPTWLLEWGGEAFMSHLSSISSGVAILLAPNFRPEILKVQELVPGRLLHLAVRLDGVPLRFVNVYAPKPAVLQTRLFREVSTLLSSIDPGDCVILGGDFNCTLEEGDRSGIQRGQELMKKLKELVGSSDLVDTWRNLHPDSRAFSRRSKGGWVSHRPPVHFTGVPSPASRRPLCCRSRARTTTWCGRNLLHCARGEGPRTGTLTTGCWRIAASGTRLRGSGIPGRGSGEDFTPCGYGGTWARPTSGVSVRSTLEGRPYTREAIPRSDSSGASCSIWIRV